MEAKIKELMADIFEVKADQITDDLEAKDVPWWDSLKHFSMVTALEEEFGIQMTMDEIQAMVSFNKVVETISKYRKSN